MRTVMTKQGSTRRHKTTSVRGRGGGPAHEDRVLRIEDARDKYTKLRIEENKLGGKIVCAGERERDEMTNQALSAQPPSPPLDGRADC